MLGAVIGVVGLLPLCERPTLVRLSVEPHELNLRAGEAVPIDVWGQMSDGRPASPRILRKASWTTTAAEVAVYRDSLMVTREPGRALVRAHIGEIASTVVVTVADRNGQAPRGVIGARPQQLPSPGQGVAKVTLTKGASAVGAPGCSAAGCARLHVTLSERDGTLHSIACHDHEGAWYVYQSTERETENCYYGFPGRQVWVVVDGRVESNRVVW